MAKDDEAPLSESDKGRMVDYLQDAIDFVLEGKIDGLAVVLLHVDGLVATAVAGKTDLAMVGGIERLKSKLIMGMEASEVMDRRELHDTMREGLKATKQ